MVQWAVDAARTVADGVVLVLPALDAPGVGVGVGAGVGVGDDLVTGADVSVSGGDTRAASVRAGLAAVPLSAPR